MRLYSKAHLASHPNQIVKQISLTFDLREQHILGYLSVLIAGQGDSMQKSRQFLRCDRPFVQPGPDIWSCHVDCDGGGMEITLLEGKQLEFQTQHLRTGTLGGCGGQFNLAESLGQTTRYKLFLADAEHCDTSLPDFEKYYN